MGTYTDCLEFDVKFESHLPARLGLPKIENNYAEGIVIKPLKELHVNTKKGTTRAIVKKKAVEFQEIRYHDAKKPMQERNTDVGPLETLKWEIPSYVTENRLHNAISKFGSFSCTDKVFLKNLFVTLVDDVMNDLEENNFSEFQVLVSEDKNSLRELAGNEVKVLITSFIKRQKKGKK
eukprot:TRINITY_DN6941_c0_g1_i4.p2 TRINITY_DN6941_c0_g1~~TRINITY_DN6941_c0_g1_i4.p2  ORF type:complete len:178 (-),score=43.49 TRINITY_DN6941_c0_g1_i4:41-574(-)